MATRPAQVPAVSPPPLVFTVLSRAAHIDSDVTAAIKQSQMGEVWPIRWRGKKEREGGGGERDRAFNLQRRQTSERVIFQSTAVTDVGGESKRAIKAGTELLDDRILVNCKM